MDLTTTDGSSDAHSKAIKVSESTIEASLNRRIK